MRPTPIRHIPEDQSLLHLFPAPGRTVTAQRTILVPHVFSRDGRCWVPGCKVVVPVTAHEGVITRGDARGWPTGWKCLIHVPYNTIMLCTRHHNTFWEPSRIEVADWMYEQHGDDWVRWLETLPFKLRPPRVREWLDGHYGA